MSWPREAACLDSDPALFFPPPNPLQGRRDYRAARAICAVCPVIEDCLEYVLTFERQGRREGMWGGTSPFERDQRGENRCYCEVCGTLFTPPRAVRLCSDECRKQAGVRNSHDHYHRRRTDA